MICPTCHRDGYDPAAEHRAARAQEDAFVRAYKGRVRCENCKKLLSVHYESIAPWVKHPAKVGFRCSRCDHHQEVDQVPVESTVEVAR